MENIKEWLTVQEVAALAGVSPQSIYKRLNQEGNELNEYVKTFSNKKKIHCRALQDVYNLEVAEVEQPEVNEATENKPEENQIETVLLEVVEELRNQLQTKDNQITNLNQQIANLNNQVTNLTEAVRTAQALQANTERKLIEAEERQQEQPDPEQKPDKERKTWKFWKW